MMATGYSLKHRFVSDRVREPWAIAFGDLDSDRTLDVLSASAGSDVVAWYQSTLLDSIFILFR